MNKELKKLYKELDIKKDFLKHVKIIISFGLVMLVLSIIFIVFNINFQILREEYNIVLIFVSLGLLLAGVLIFYHNKYQLKCLNRKIRKLESKNNDGFTKENVFQDSVINEILIDEEEKTLYEEIGIVRHYLEWAKFVLYFGISLLILSVIFTVFNVGFKILDNTYNIAFLVISGVFTAVGVFLVCTNKNQLKRINRKNKNK